MKIRLLSSIEIGRHGIYHNSPTNFSWRIIFCDENCYFQAGFLRQTIDRSPRPFVFFLKNLAEKVRELEKEVNKA
jgi:hypothetical protein